MGTYKGELRASCSVEGVSRHSDAPQPRGAPALTLTTAGAAFSHQPEQPCLRPEEPDLCSGLASGSDADAILCRPGTKSAAGVRFALHF